MFKWVVLDVEPKEDFTLLLTFARGKKRVFDCKKYLFDDDYAKPLQDINLFMNCVNSDWLNFHCLINVI